MSGFSGGGGESGREEKSDIEEKEEVSAFLQEALDAVVVFHDIGKINPLFQKKIKNPEFASWVADYKIGFRHSIFSAILYLDYFIGKLKKWKEERGMGKELLRNMSCIIFLNSYAIAKHHSNLGKFEAYVGDFFGEVAVYKEYIKEIKEKLLPVCGLSYPFLKKNYISKYAMRVDFLLKNENGREDAAEKGDGQKEKEREKSIVRFIYLRMVYSLLLASDYYATGEHMSEVAILQTGELDDIKEFLRAYENTPLYQKIRAYEAERKEENPDAEWKASNCCRKHEVPAEAVEKIGQKSFENISDLNVLRSELFLDAERELEKHIGEKLFFLEAPTGTGKSNTALNLSFRFVEKEPDLKKIFYIYPYNTLVEQNENILEKSFGENQELYRKIHVINSQHSVLKKAWEAEEPLCYEQVWLDRQFMNYPITLSTHVTLFEILFDERKEAAFSFHQIANSVIVLDEIQSYRNEIWAEIITFLNVFARYLNLRVILMSATLPAWDELSMCREVPVRLIRNREKYYKNPLIQNRCRIHYELLEERCEKKKLGEEIRKHLDSGKKVLLQFISKKTAEDFFSSRREYLGNWKGNVAILTGDDNVMERKKVLERFAASPKGEAFLLIGTQVLEAGLDITNADVGFKDISILDSEEQFMGRINRLCNMKSPPGYHDAPLKGAIIRKGEVYFFSLDSASNVYRKDVRRQKELTLENSVMRRLLEEKDFASYYRQVMEQIRRQNGTTCSQENISVFFDETVKYLNMPEISERMKLIIEEERKVRVFFNREIEINGKLQKGSELWKNYQNIWKDSSMPYAEKKLKLQDLQVRMDYFIYEVSELAVFQYDERNFDQVGEIYYVDESEKYFCEGRFLREEFEKGYQLLI